MAQPQPQPRNFHLTEEEFLQIVEERVRRIYGISLDEYLEAKKAGTLPWKVEGGYIEVLLGERAP
jgi:hypothetical protein